MKKILILDLLALSFFSILSFFPSIFCIQCWLFLLLSSTERKVREALGSTTQFPPYRSVHVSGKASIDTLSLLSVLSIHLHSFSPFAVSSFPTLSTVFPFILFLSFFLNEYCSFFHSFFSLSLILLF